MSPGRALLVVLLLAPAGVAARPSDLAPGAPELQEAELRLVNLLDTSRAVAAATSRLQTEWALPPREPAPKKPPPKGKPPDPSRDWTALTRVPSAPSDLCADPERLTLGWRIEVFGSAWRETAQASMMAAAEVQAVRVAPTVSPLVDAAWRERLDRSVAEASLQVTAWREASEWQARFVRPVIQACPAPPIEIGAGVATRPVLAVGEAPPRIAVMGRGDGWVCPEGLRADDAVVLVEGPTACWSATLPCNCDRQPVEPGAVLGP